jgi:hypothetical protein
MRRSALMMSLALATTVWGLSVFAKPPDGDKPDKPDKPGSGLRPHASATRPLGSMPRPPGSGPRPAGSVGAHPHDLAGAMRGNQARSEASKARLAELANTRQARRVKHLETFRLRYPQAVLSDPHVRNELRHHARRMAFLHRAEFLAKHELEEPKKTQVLERVKRLLAREEARHTKRMEKLRSAASPPGSASVKPVLAAPKGSAK